MNVKNLLMALAVPTAFAACSQDEFVNEVQGTNDGRPIVGSISLNLPERTQTRWGWGSTTGFTFDDTDFIGACLMDKFEPGGSGWAGKYPVVDYINTNYKYGYKDGWTNSDAVMSEGNYFFYLPYNNTLKSRAGLVYSIPADQFAYDETAATPVKDESRSWKKNQMFIGYDDIKVNDQQATPQMVELHAKPRFTVKYAGSNNVVVERIVMRDETGKFAVKGALKPTGEIAGYNPIAATPENTTYKISETANLAITFDKYKKALSEYELQEGESFVNPLSFDGGNGSFVSVVEGEKVSDLSLNFVPAKEVSALMVVPVGEHTLTNLEFDIYTNKGMVSFTSNENGVLEEAADKAAITYSNIDKLATIKAGQGVKADAVTINFGDIDITQPDEVTVSTTSQLESIIRWYADIEKDLTVNLASDNVELSEKVYSTIKGNSKLTVKFTGGTLNIPATAKNDALSLVDVESTNTIKVAGTQDLANTAHVTLSYEIEVAANATLNINAGTKTTTVQNITNVGMLNIVAGNVVVANTKAITNTKTLTIAENATLEAKVLNNADFKVANNTTTYTQNAVITNNGMLNLLDGSENQCTINNNNKLDVKGTTTNNRVDASTAVGSKTNGYIAVINNSDANKSYIYANAALTNKGDIINYGAMYSQSSGTIVNNEKAYIKAEDGSTTYVTTNNGEIELAKRTTETTVNGGTGLKSYTMTGGDLSSGTFSFDKTSDKFNSLKIGQDVKFKNSTDVPENIVLMNKNLTVTCKDETNFKSIIAKAGFRYMLQGVKVQTAKLTVEEGAVFQIPALSKFAVYVEETIDINSTEMANDVVGNKGEILVGGNFYANFAGYIPTGTLSSAGTGSYDWDDANKDFVKGNNN